MRQQDSTTKTKLHGDKITSEKNNRNNCETHKNYKERLN